MIFPNYFSPEKLDKICPNYGAWDEIWGGRINVDPGYIFESGNSEASIKAASTTGSDIDADERDEETSYLIKGPKITTSKKRGYWSQSSNAVVDLGQQRNEIL
jgi:hypothetical protein